MVTSDNLQRDTVHNTKLVASDGPLASHDPRFNGSEWAYSKDCLVSIFLSSVAKFVDLSEVDLANFSTANYAVALVP